MAPARKWVAACSSSKKPGELGIQKGPRLLSFDPLFNLLFLLCSSDVQFEGSTPSCFLSSFGAYNLCS